VLVVVVRTVVVAASVIVTVAPAITAPVGSVIVPTTVPVLVACPKAVDVCKHTDASSRITAANVLLYEISRAMLVSFCKCFLFFPARMRPQLKRRSCLALDLESALLETNSIFQLIGLDCETAPKQNNNSTQTGGKSSQIWNCILSLSV
jgi:hypothetical protein